MAAGRMDGNPRRFTLPLMLVGAIAAGALLPHLTPSSSNSTSVAQVSRSAPSASSGDADSTRVTTAVDLLADYFGEDVTPARLRRLVRDAAKQVRTLTPNAPATREQAQAAVLLRAFYCMNIRSKPKGALHAVWAQAQSTPPPPDCNDSDTTTLSIESTAAFAESYLNDDIKRDHVTVTRVLPSATVDESRLLADDFDTVNKDPLAWAIVDAAAARHRINVQFLVATVPDPIDSYETWQFDPYVDAIRQGIEASGYLLDRFHLPDAGVDRKGGGTSTSRDLHTHWPGVVLFRWKTTDIPPPIAGQDSLLVLFLVPETPVAGIHAEPFVRAVDFATGWMSRHPSSPGHEIRILGPSFSGSTPSLVRALSDVDARVGARLGHATVTVVSGSASNDGNRRAFESPEAPYAHMTVNFRATIHSNSAIDLASRCFLREVGVRGPFAYLSEGSTAYGSARDAGKESPDADRSCAIDSEDAGKDITIKFPFNIAQLRSDASRSGGTRQDPLAGVLPGLRPLSLEDVTTPTDQLPLQTPTTTAPSVELVLTNLLDAIRRENVRVVSVSATDVRDKLFLVREIRQRAPDVLLITTDADLFQVHPDETPWLRGVLVVSTYPLHASSQDFVYPFRGLGAAERPNADLVQFSSVSMEGLHNAAIALLNYQADGRPQTLRFRDSAAEESFGNRPWLPRLVDYGGLGPNCGGGEPAVWISVVGEGQLVPLRLYCNLEERLNLAEAQRYVFRPALPALAPPASTHRVPVSSASELLVILLEFVCGLLCLVAWLQRDAVLSAKRGALAVLVCGPVIALTFLGAVLPALAWQQWGAGELFMAAVTTTAALVCLIELGAGLAFQWRCRSRYYVPLRGLFLFAAVAAGAYAVSHLQASPQLFLLRTFDVGTMMSPLLAVSVFAAIPVAPAGVELWRLQALGVTVEDGDQTPDQWARCLDSVASWAGVKMEGIRESLVRSHQSLLLLPWSWRWVSILSTALAGALVFHVDRHPLLSIEGQLFGWSVVFFVLFLQWAFGAALLRFVYAACFTAQFLTRAAPHADALPYGDVPAELSPLGLVPARPRLRELRFMAADVPGGLATLQADLERRHPAPRWFQTVTWTSVRDELDQIVVHPSPGILGSDVEMRRQTLMATSMVFVVRELLSRLTVSLLMIGPGLALLTILYATLYFDQSHGLLGLIWVDVLVSIAVIMTVFVWMERDTVISRIRRTTPGEIEWNWDFVWKLLVYVVLPLLTLFATQFPNIGSSLVRLLEPVQRLPGN